MSRAVRPTTRADLERLSDTGLRAYIVDTKGRADAMTKATLRKVYANQLRIAETVMAERKNA
jgi:hypothetical protein